MTRTRIVYGGPMLQHWSSVWLRWLGTVRGLCVWTALMSVVAIINVWPVVGQDGLNDMLLLSLPVVGIIRIARHLSEREREPGLQTPDASMRVLFEIAWLLGMLLILLPFAIS